MKRNDPGAVRVVRDVRDGSRDYWISATEAHRLRQEGKLSMVQVHGDHWDYFEERPK